MVCLRHWVEHRDHAAGMRRLDHVRLEAVIGGDGLTHAIGCYVPVRANRGDPRSVRSRGLSYTRPSSPSAHRVSLKRDTSYDLVSALVGPVRMGGLTLSLLPLIPDGLRSAGVVLGIVGVLGGILAGSVTILREAAIARDAFAKAILPERTLRRRALSKTFREFASESKGSGEALYAELAFGVSKDRRLLDLASKVRPGQPIPNLLLASVHYLLLEGAEHPLREFFADIVESPSSAEGAYPVFRAFCLSHEATLGKLLAERLVQTNEVRRSAMFLPAFGIVSRESGGKPLALIELGASAGLNLLCDQYGFNYGGGVTFGDPTSPVQLHCETRGERKPPLPDRPLRIASRIGVDLSPVDLRDPDALLWLLALVRPTETWRRELLRAAGGVMLQHPVNVVKGDAVASLGTLLQSAPPDTAVCVFHSYFVNQIGEEGRNRLSAALQQAGRDRDLYHVSLEYAWPENRDQLELEHVKDGAPSKRVLAVCDNRGAWLEWLREGLN